LAYQTFKVLVDYKDLDSETKGGQVMSIELRDRFKQNDDSIIRMLMKW
jgi:hypothetical protein